MAQPQNRARQIALPSEAAICDLYKGADLADAYAVTLQAPHPDDPLTLARCALAQPAPWVSRLLKARDGIMRHFGVKTARELADLERAGRQNRVGIFRVFAAAPHEVVLGEDDAHLDFRVSVLVRSDELVVTTVVHCHNRLGRLYIAVIAPFHRLVVQSGLNRGSRTGWRLKGAPGAA